MADLSPGAIKSKVQEAIQTALTQSDEVVARVEKAVQAALNQLGVGMRKLAEDEETCSAVVNLAYEALPLPFRLFLKKDRFEGLVISLKNRYLDKEKAAASTSDQLALPLGQAISSEHSVLDDTLQDDSSR